MTSFAVKRACCVRIASLLPLLIAFLLPQVLLLAIWALAWLASLTAWQASSVDCEENDY
jgi:hypothetical protein